MFRELGSSADWRVLMCNLTNPTIYRYSTAKDLDIVFTSENMICHIEMTYFELKLMN